MPKCWGVEGGGAGAPWFPCTYELEFAVGKSA